MELHKSGMSHGWGPLRASFPLVTTFLGKQSHFEMPIVVIKQSIVTT